MIKFRLLAIVTLGSMFLGNLSPAGAEGFDAAFGNDGAATVDLQRFQTGMPLPRVAMTSDEKILFGGVTGDDPDTDFLIARFTGDGVLDSSFGLAGKTRIGLEAEEDTLNAIALDPDGYVIGGDPITFELTAARALSSGSAVATFDGRTGNVDLPRVEVETATGTSLVGAEMALIPDSAPLRFQVTRVDSL